MSLQKKQFVAQNAVLTNCTVQIIEPRPEKKIPESYRISLFGKVFYGETDIKADFSVDIADDVKFESLSEEAKKALEDLLVAAKGILLEKYILKAKV